MQRFFLKAAFFLFLIISLQLAVSPRLDHPLPSNVRRLQESLLSPVDVMIFGDSVSEWCSPDDTDERSIGEFLQQALPGTRVGPVFYPSANPELYLIYCQYLVRHHRLPRMMIVPINLKAFSPYWDRNPALQFTKERFLFRHQGEALEAFFSPLGVFQLFVPPVSELDYHQTPVYRGDLQAGEVGDYLEDPYHAFSYARLKDRILLYYLYGLSEDQRQLRCLQDIAALLRENGVRVLFYLTPIDHAVGSHFFSGDFRRQVTGNTQVIRSALENGEARLLDLTFALKHKRFSWYKRLDTGYINEHLDAEGREFVARQLARELRRLEWVEEKKQP